MKLDRFRSDRIGKPLPAEILGAIPLTEGFLLRQRLRRKLTILVIAIVLHSKSVTQ